MTKKRILACALIACVIIGALSGAFWWIKFGSQKHREEQQAVANATATTATPADAVGAESGEAGTAEQTGTTDAKKANAKGDGSFEKENEVETYGVPTEKKEEFATDPKYRFSAEPAQHGATVARLQTTLHNWESYPYGPECDFVSGASSTQWVSIIKLRQAATGMSDGVAWPITIDDPDLAYEELATVNGRCIAWAVGVARFMSKWLYIDKTPFSETNPELVDFVKEDEAAQERAKELKNLKAQLDRLRYKPDSDMQKAAVIKQIEELESQGCGVGRWLDATDDPNQGQLNDEFLGYLAIELNIMDSFEVIGFENVYSEVNYYLPISGDVDQIRLIENKSYQEINQPALVLGMLDKNGKVSMKWGFDKRDSRPLKVLEWSKNPSNPKNKVTVIKQKDSTPKQPPVQPQQQQQQQQQQQATTKTIINNNNNNRQTTNNTTNNNNNTTNSSTTTTTTETTEVIINVDPGPDPESEPTPQPDGEGGKNQSEASAIQDHAPQESGTHISSDGDGQKTEESKQTNTTVTEGSSDSDRRSLNEQAQQATGDSSAQVPAQQATNGSTESTDTSSREAAGTTDSSGAVADNEGNSSSTTSETFTVPEAAAEAATPAESNEGQAEYVPSDG